MTKKELASRINVDPKTLKNWETTKPELIQLINLGLNVENYLKNIDLSEYENLLKDEKEIIKILNLGLKTEKHIKETEEYLKQLKN